MEENDTCVFIHLGKVIPSQNIAVAGVVAAGLSVQQVFSMMANRPNKA